MIISLKNTTKIYGGKHNKSKTVALNNVSLNVESGEMVAIMGKSGCGKSTLINILGGLVMPSDGEYYFDNEKLLAKNNAMSLFRRDNIGFIVQNFALINNRTARENIALALNKKMSKYKRNAAVETVAKSLGIYDKLDSFPSEMSGGECQRTAIARAIINKPKVILADEPTGALDSENGKNVIKIIRSLVNDGKTAIVVTHDEETANACDRIIYMSDGLII